MMEILNPMAVCAVCAGLVWAVARFAQDSSAEH